MKRIEVKILDKKVGELFFEKDKNKVVLIRGQESVNSSV